MNLRAIKLLQVVSDEYIQISVPYLIDKLELKKIDTKKIFKRKSIEHSDVYHQSI